jgi:hypothetical protein
MRTFSHDVVWAALMFLALFAFCLIPLETWMCAPDLCLWRRLLHLAACPACGSTRALVAFFHGEWSAAWKYNANVVITAPALLALVVSHSLSLWRKIRSTPSSNLRSCSGLNTVLKPE